MDLSDAYVHLPCLTLCVDVGSLVGLAGKPARELRDFAFSGLYSWVWLGEHMADLPAGLLLELGESQLRRGFRADESGITVDGRAGADLVIIATGEALELLGSLLEIDIKRIINWFKFFELDGLITCKVPDGDRLGAFV
jgi:hypothetical protein